MTSESIAEILANLAEAGKEILNDIDALNGVREQSIEQLRVAMQGVNELERECQGDRLKLN